MFNLRRFRDGALVAIFRKEKPYIHNFIFLCSLLTAVYIYIFFSGGGLWLAELFLKLYCSNYVLAGFIISRGSAVAIPFRFSFWI